MGCDSHSGSQTPSSISANGHDLFAGLEAAGCKARADIDRFICMFAELQARRVAEGELQGNRWNVMACIISPPQARSVGGAAQNVHPLAVAGPRASDDLDKLRCDASVNPGRTTFYSHVNSLALVESHK